MFIFIFICVESVCVVVSIFICIIVGIISPCYCWCCSVVLVHSTTTKTEIKIKWEYVYICVQFVCTYAEHTCCVCAVIHRWAMPRIVLSQFHNHFGWMVGCFGFRCFGEWVSVCLYVHMSFNALDFFEQISRERKTHTHTLHKTTSEWVSEKWTQTHVPILNDEATMSQRGKRAHKNLVHALYCHWHARLMVYMHFISGIPRF